MKHALMKLPILMAVLCGMPSAATAGGWKHLATQGFRHFVVVDTATMGSEAALIDAASAICVAKKPCLVLYWTDESKAASRMPMTKAQSESVAAQFRRNPATGQEELLLRCTTNEATERCLR